jgi:subfamily B ATP-binding cassette protein MsbA
VRFEHVTLRYDDGPAALRDFSLDVAPGEMIALVGRSGAGKTTVTNLLLRFYRPTSGRILVDGQPIEDVPLADLRRQIGLVQQDIFLFSGSILENIAYARPGAKAEDVIEAARAANAHDFILHLPHRYQTEVGERGVKLSGGQRQRLAIARALLRDPRILIFDEATSHLDSESEGLVQAALDRVARGRTVFVIAHRLSTIDRADRIVVIDDGAIQQVGKHDELLKESPVYRRLYGLQAGREPTAAARREEKRLRV